MKLGSITRSAGTCSTSYSTPELGLSARCNGRRHQGLNSRAEGSSPPAFQSTRCLMRAVGARHSNGSSLRCSTSCSALNHGTPAAGVASGSSAVISDANGIALHLNARSATLSVGTPTEGLAIHKVGVSSSSSSSSSSYVEGSHLPPPTYVVDRDVRKSESFAQLHELVADPHRNMDSQTLANTLSTLAKLRRAAVSACSVSEVRRLDREHVQPMLVLLRPRVLNLVTQMDCWGASMSLWSYAVLEHYDADVFVALCKCISLLASSLRTVDCCMIMYAFGHLGHMDVKVVKHVVQTLLNNLDQAKPHELSITLWAFAALRYSPDPKFMVVLADHVQWEITRFGAQELSNVLYAFGTLGFRPHPRFLALMERVTLQRLPHLRPQDIANSAWAFGKLQYKAVDLLDELPRYVLPNLAQYNTVEQLQLLYAYTAPRHYHKGLCDGITDSLTGRLADLTHHDISMVMWSLSMLQHRPTNPAFMPELTAEVHSRMRFFKPVSLALIAKAFSVIGWRSEAMLKELVRMAENKLPDFRLQELAHLLYGIHKLQYLEPSVYQAAVRRSIQVLEDTEARNRQGLGAMPLPAARPMGRMSTADNDLYMLVPVLNSISSSCQAAGFVPWTLIDYAESKGMRLRQPVSGTSSQDGEDEAGDATAARDHAAHSRSQSYGSRSWSPGQQQGQQQRQQAEGEQGPQTGRKKRPQQQRVRLGGLQAQQGASQVRVPIQQRRMQPTSSHMPLPLPLHSSMPLVPLTAEEHQQPSYDAVQAEQPVSGVESCELSPGQHQQSANGQQFQQELPEALHIAQQPELLASSQGGGTLLQEQDVALGMHARDGLQHNKCTQCACTDGVEASLHAQPLRVAAILQDGSGRSDGGGLGAAQGLGPTAALVGAEVHDPDAQLAA